MLGQGMRHTAKRLEDQDVGKREECITGRLLGDSKDHNRDTGSCCYIWASDGSLK